MKSLAPKAAEPTTELTWGYKNGKRGKSGARRTGDKRSSGFQEAALKHQLLQKGRTSECVNQKDMLKHLLSGITLHERALPDDCQEANLDRTALASNLTDADSFIDPNHGVAPASVMSANLKKNFLPTDPYNQVHDLNKTLIKINDRTKSNNLSSFISQGLARR